MKEKDKKSKRELSDFLKYRKKEMTGRERNAFERELQKDPFTEEATEGWESVASEQIRSDVRRMKADLSARTGRRSIPAIYRVAASLLIILAVGSLITISTRKSGKVDNKIAIESKITEAPDTAEVITEQVAFAVRPQEKEVAAEPANQKKEKVAIKDETITIPETANISDDELKAAKAETDTAIAFKAFAIKDIPEKNMARSVAAPAAIVSDYRKSEALVEGRIISSEDNLPLPGVTVHIKGTTIGTSTDINGIFSFPAGSVAGKELVASYIGMKPREFEAKNNAFNEIKLDPDITALEEVVVVGYGISRKQEAAGAATRIEMTDKTPFIKYSPPEPVTGKEAFDKYIEESIRKPGDYIEGDRIVVVVSFVVTRSGIIDSMKVLRSGGESFSEEALRLVKEGPSWKPATENGIKIDDEVRIRIVFK